MEEVGKRLRALRDSIAVPQTRMAEILDSTQSSINRYENGQSEPTVELLRRYADYFDVSMDYIFGRCDNPQGKLYEAKPPLGANPEMAKFIEKCFEPGTAMNSKLKAVLLELMQQGE